MVKVFLPALDTAVYANGDETLLADGTAEAARLVTGSQMSKSVCQVIKLAAVEQLRGHVVLEPQNLGDLHLDAHLAANILEQLVAGSVDLVRFLDWTVIKP